MRASTSEQYSESLLQQVARDRDAAERSDDQEREEDENVWADEECIDVDDMTPVSKKCLDFKVLWTYMGPGWLMSIAYLDPGNLEADLQAGAYAGYELLWVLMWCTVIGFALQVLAARLGVATGRNLAQVCREEYSKYTVWLLWIMTEMAIIGSDIQEVIGGAIALHVLFGLALPYGTILMAVSTFALLYLQKYGIRKIELIFAFFIGVMIVAFWTSMIIAKPDPLSIVQGMVVPKVSSYALTQAVGILGAVIMPHNIYLHSALVTSRKLNRNNEDRVGESMKYNAIESGFALFVSFLVNLAVVSTFAVSYFEKDCAERGDGQYQACVPLEGLLPAFINPSGHGVMNGTQTCIPTDFHGPSPQLGFVCANIGLNNAGAALANLFPGTSVAKYIWGVGLLAAGQASTITGTYAGQFVMAGFLDIRIQAWQRMLFTRVVALGPAVVVAWLTQGFPNTSDQTNEWLNVLQSVQLPFALLPVLHLTSQRKYMGNFVNPWWLKLLCWLLAVVVIVTNIYLVTMQVKDYDTVVVAITLVAGVGYFIFLLVIIRRDLLEFGAWISGCCCPSSRRPSGVQ